MTQTKHEEEIGAKKLPNRLSGKTAIITGAAQGMGANHARRFVAEGANVVIADIQVEKGQVLAEELGDRARFTTLDVSRESSWDSALATARQEFGLVNVLVNNAALYSAQSVEQETIENVRRILEINIFGSWLGLSKVVPLMREAGAGSIINVSSLAGARGIPHHSIYGASKWAIRGLTKSAAHDLGPDNIRVNAVLPGAINNTGMFSGMDDTQILAIPLRRPGSLDEVTNLVIFLASDDSSYVTGCDHIVDGGRALW
ncbi:MAG: SDR family NAD(P)-dependent oxidoreductase [Pseudomonadales bacterium]